jgi:hypothetical protein
VVIKSGKKIGLVRFLNNLAQKIFVAFLFVPFAFIFLKLNKWAIVDGATVDNFLMAPLRAAFPLLPQQYNVIAKVAGADDANSFVIFILVEIFIFMISSAYILWRFTRGMSSIEPPGGMELLLSFAGIFGLFAVRVLEVATVNDVPLSTFSIDTFGLYYLHVYFVYLGVFIFLYVPILSAIKLLDMKFSSEN